MTVVVSHRAIGPAYDVELVAVDHDGSRTALRREELEPHDEFEATLPAGFRPASVELSWSRRPADDAAGPGRRHRELDVVDPYRPRREPGR